MLERGKNGKIYKKKHNTNYNRGDIYLILFPISKEVFYLYQFRVLSCIADILLYKERFFFERMAE